MTLSKVKVKYTKCKLLLQKLEVVHILHNECLWRVYDNECFVSPMWPLSQGCINTKSGSTDCNTNFSYCTF